MQISSLREDAPKRLQTKKEPGKRSNNVYRAPCKPLVIYFVAVTKSRLSYDLLFYKNPKLCFGNSFQSSLAVFAR